MERGPEKGSRQTDKEAGFTTEETMKDREIISAIELVQAGKPCLVVLVSSCPR